jgi:two-component system, OmpR family, phosphate regulon sensor histidine kinase PhoR
MVYSPRTLSFLLAASVAVITSLCLSMLKAVSREVMIVAAVISFSSSYILIFAALEFLIFREIDKIYKLMEKLRKKELSDFTKQKSGTLSPMEKITEEIYSFAVLKQKEIDELKKLEAFRKEFIADVSHELKTPLFAAQGFVHTLLDGAMHDKNVRIKFLKKAAKSLDGLDALVQDLLTLSQIETGEIKMKFAHIDMYRLCMEVVEQFEEKAAKKNIRLRLQSDQHKIMVYADWQRITQVVTNLVSNAISYTPDDGEVTVSFDVGKKNVTTFVTDSGEGIPPQHIHRIFERFYRVDKSRSRERGGTGLGLAIVKHILEGHKSKAEVQSSLGKGSVFSFKLPRNKSDSSENQDGL